MPRKIKEIFLISSLLLLGITSGLTIRRPRDVENESPGNVSVIPTFEADHNDEVAVTKNVEEVLQTIVEVQTLTTLPELKVEVAHVGTHEATNQHQQPAGVHHSQDHHEEHQEPHGVKVASFKFDYVKAPLVLTTFIVLIGLLKIVYHHTTYVQKLIPESCLLIILGALIGYFFFQNVSSETISFLKFDSKTFFLYLLPPIILESAFSLRDRAFIDNLGTIVLYAVVGTVLNIAIIGGFLILLGHCGFLSELSVDPLDCLLFASLIAAVDPVAVLAIFQEVGVNKMLYFMVFGESLLNDAVTVVVYNLVNEFKELPRISFHDCFLGFLAFLCVALGGLAIGIVCGVLSAIITKFTEHVRVVEPVIVFGMAYLSYVCSELFHFSGIIGIIGCGLFQAHYTVTNISSKTFISVNYSAKVLSSVSESLIFIILGVMLVNQQSWFWSEMHPLFTIYALLLCIIARIVVVFFLTYLVNGFTGGVRYISFNEQLIMAYGGLRGAVSFSLAFMMDDAVPTKGALLAATYVVILFTVFVQGCTIKSLVKILDIRLAHLEDNYRLFLEFHKGMVNNMAQGIEDLCGYKGNFSWIAFVHLVSKRFIRPLLHKNYHSEIATTQHEKLVLLEREISLRENLQAAPVARSHKMHKSVDQMADQGEMSREMLEAEPFIFGKQKNSEDLTRQISDIRNLVRNPLNDFYNDRNLVDEDEKLEKQKTAMEHLQWLQSHASGDFSVTARKRSLFGQQKEKRKMCAKKGMLALGAAGAIGFSNQDVASESIPEGEEVHYSSSQVSHDQSEGSDSPESLSRKRIVSEGDSLRQELHSAPATDPFQSASQSDLQTESL